MHEAKVESYFCAQVKKRGGEVRKVKWIGRRHAPDRLALFPYTSGGAPGRHVFVELKRPGKDATEAQAREHVRLRLAAVKVYVLDTIEKVDKFFRDHDRGVWL